MEQQLPLVTIGIPTFNRPASLRKTLEIITKQTYRNIEVVVSDNATPGEEIKKIQQEFLKNDNRVKFFIQPENKGAVSNFFFVLNQASGNFFMWAADDDQWEGEHFLGTLMQHAPQHILVFPSAEVTNEKGEISYPLKAYETCVTAFDYSKQFCRNGWGYPFYGVYNLTRFREHGLKFEFDNDLAYYTEGTFLHRLFLAGPCKYASEARIKFRAYGSLPSVEVCIDSWTQYFKRTLLIYHQSELATEKKNLLINLILKDYSAYSKKLFEKLVGFDQMASDSQPGQEVAQKNNIFIKIILRLKRTLQVLIKGQY